MSKWITGQDCGSGQDQKLEICSGARQHAYVIFFSSIWEIDEEEWKQEIE